MNGRYCIYLRKSRKDDIGEPDEILLARHQKMLTDHANKLGLEISKVYSEGFVSGDSIAARPVMQQLLDDVDANMWDGVLVTEFSRLARGNVRDQGVVLEAFALSGTKIITPDKTFDLSNEDDETFTEFGLLMSRQEYKAIKRRMQAGRLRSARDGRYQGSIAPYGYDKVRIADNRSACTLKINESEAPTVRLIYELYVSGTMGASAIATHLNSLHLPARKGGAWVDATVRGILTNPVYCGKITWNRRKVVRTRVDGEVKRSRPRADKSAWIIADGLHPAIIDDETWHKAQSILASRVAAMPPVKKDRELTNPLSGLIECGVCGRKMVRKASHGSQPAIVCSCASCSNASAILKNVEDSILRALSDWCTEYKTKLQQLDSSEPERIKNSEAEAALIEETKQLQERLARLHDFLERGVYDIETFVRRRNLLTQNIEQVAAQLSAIKEEKKRNNSVAIAELIPRIEQAVSTYQAEPAIKAKNLMLKTVLKKVVYTRPRGGRWTDPYNFTIQIFPRI